MGHTNELDQVKTAGAPFELHDERYGLTQTLRQLFLTDPGGHPSILDNANEDVVFRSTQGPNAFAIHPTKLVGKGPTKVVGFGRGASQRIVSLHPCPECQTLVSQSARACPKCGRPNPTQRRASKASQLGAVWGVVALGVVIALFGLFLFFDSYGLYHSAGTALLWVGALVVIAGFKLIADVAKRKEW